jgi:hypothetical protein
MTRIVIDDHATCLTCGYPLHKLTRCRCPECGRRFDPFVRGTYGPRRSDGFFLPWINPGLVF